MKNPQKSKKTEKIVFMHRSTMDALDQEIKDYFIKLEKITEVIGGLQMSLELPDRYPGSASASAKHQLILLGEKREEYKKKIMKVARKMTKIQRLMEVE
jgi:hypothetical protein